MAAPKYVKNAKLTIDGMDVGRVATSATRSLHSVKADLKFKPNWVGLWKLQALMAERDGDGQ